MTEGGAGLIDGALVQPIVDIATSNVTELLPAGITLMGLMIGISLIPRIVYKFF